MRAMVIAGGVCVVVGVGLVWLIVARGGGGSETGAAAGTAVEERARAGGLGIPAIDAAEQAERERERVLAELRAELSRASPVAGRTDEQRLADAQAWVRANRPADRPYNELEATMLALMEAAFDGEERSAAWLMNTSLIEIELARALDADGDGMVTDEEVQAFIESGLAMMNPLEHPYLAALFDQDGDGVLSPGEFEAVGAARVMEGALAGALQRAQLDAWDMDNDGFVSDAEREAGLREADNRIRFHPDGRVEFVLDGSTVDPVEQAAIRAQLAEQFGEDYARAMEAHMDMMRGQAMMMPLLNDMRVDDFNRDELQAAMMRDMPQMPDAREFSSDGSGNLTQEDFAVYEAAIQEYNRTIQEWSTRQMALMLREQFEHARRQGDLDGDGRISPDEWERRIDTLLDARADRMMLRVLDLDGDGWVGAHELARYLDWYRAGSLRADANFDGVVDARDLELVTRYFRAGR
ncbi:MAG: hypothetical protein KIS87_10110 [Phycisphaeraceae bacterium]|nr:hypothetical protein [Phycisphaeraceae bacterium]